ncbi:MAG: ABC transporter permease [Clostridiales bacterium]|nr:ABC transporter permease [Clostridiales bacterium]
MWKDYSKSYIKNNRASSISVMAAAFIAAMFLSLLCCIAYNFWIYEIENIVLEEGGWQGRITGMIDEADLSMIQNFANVREAVINTELSEEEKTVIDIYFQNARTIYRDMHLIAAQLGAENDAVEYHSLLLSRYFIHNPQDSEPPMLLALYLGILIIVAISLILIIRGSFEVSMNARIHQFGIFSSIGATPKQIRICLLQEASALSVLPIISGSLIGIAISCGLIELINFYAKDVSGRHAAVFQYRPFLFAATIFVSFLTVFVSAWILAGKLSRMTPLEAMRSTGTLQLKRRKHSRILSLLFGMKGELAGNALKAQKKSLRISTISLLLSFLGFSIMLVFTTLSGISTRYTYFERYQNAWDIMLTIKDTNVSDFDLIDEVKAVSGIRAVTLYQKAETVGILAKDWQSAELTMLGGLNSIAGKSDVEGKFQVEIPLIILDDVSFLEYCSQLGITPSLDGVVVLNRIWDSVNSNFRYKQYVPFVKEDRTTATIYNADINVGTDINAGTDIDVGTDIDADTDIGADIDSRFAEVPILSYTQTAPALREEYKNYALVHFMPITMWKEVSGIIGGAEPDSYIHIFSAGRRDLADLSNLEQEIVKRIGNNYKIESENRVQEKISNDSMMNGMMVIFGGFCVLLAIIGIVNVFSNTLGFLRQRKREFAQYMSIGLTPQEMRKMFCIEAFVIAGRPLLITLPLTVLFVQFAVTASYLEPAVFWEEAPIVPILAFAVAILFFVFLAYYIGGKRLLRCDLNKVLRDDTL